MILTGNQIKWAKEQGYLDISDWDEKRLNPNSYNLRLADELMVYSYPLPSVDDRAYYVPSMEVILNHKQLLAAYQEKRISDAEYNRIIESYHKNYSSLASPDTLDMKKEMDTYTFKIPEEGYVLHPGVLYLARTMEHTETHKFVPMLEGRSSVGRLGISIHSTAGFGDIGFCGYWTLEISCVQPVRIYAGVEICQIYYYTVRPDIWIPDDEIVSCKTCRHWPPENKWPCEDCLMQNGYDRWESSIIKYGDNGKYQKNAGIQPSMMWKEFKNE